MFLFEMVDGFFFFFSRPISFNDGLLVQKTLRCLFPYPGLGLLDSYIYKNF